MTNKNPFNLIAKIIAFSFGVLMLCTVATAHASAPYATTTQVMATTSTTATLQGYYATNGNTGSMIYFEYGPTSGMGSATPTTVAPSTSGYYTQTLTGLSASTTYYFRFVIVGGGTSVHGNNIMFATSAGTTPGCIISSFGASPQTVTNGGSATLSWSTSNCAVLTLNSNGGNTNVTGLTSTVVNNITATTTFTLSGTSSVSNDSKTTTVTVQSNPTQCTIDQFYASPTQVASGSNTTLYWQTTGCTSVTIDGVSYPADGQGSFGPLYSTHSYQLIGIGNGSPQSSVSVTVAQQQNTCVINSFSPYQTSVAYGGTTTLTWTTSNCTSASINGTTVATNGSWTTPVIYGSTPFTLSAYGTNGSPSQTIYVSALGQQSQCYISQASATPTQVTYGGYTTLSWSTTGCTTIMIDGVSYPTNGQGNFGPLYTSHAYQISDVSGVTQTIYVSVTSQQTPPPYYPPQQYPTQPQIYPWQQPAQYQPPVIYQTGGYPNQNTQYQQQPQNNNYWQQQPAQQSAQPIIIQNPAPVVTTTAAPATTNTIVRYIYTNGSASRNTTDTTTATNSGFVKTQFDSYNTSPTNGYTTNGSSNLSANAFGSGFMVNSIVGWLLIALIIMIIVLLARRSNEPVHHEVHH